MGRATDPNLDLGARTMDPSRDSNGHDRASPSFLRKVDEMAVLDENRHDLDRADGEDAVLDDPVLDADEVDAAPGAADVAPVSEALGAVDAAPVAVAQGEAGAAPDAAVEAAAALGAAAA